jgi:general secretion pathway protein N
VIQQRYFVLCSAAYVSCLLLVSAPASLLDLPVRHFSNNRLALANAQGTVWHGSATPVLHTSNKTNLPLHTLDWKFEPQALLHGQLSLAIAWQNMDASAPMQLTIDRKSIALTNLLLPLPAEIIGEFSPFLKPAQFGGNLRIESPQLAFADKRLQGNATAVWSQAVSAMSSVRPLGDYQITLVTAQENIGIALSTRSGSLILNGQGSWLVTQGLQFNATAQATPDAQDSLTELLHHLGPESSPGVFNISL